MSPDHPDSAPPLEAEDFALESSLRSLVPRPPHPHFLNHLFAHLEQSAHDEAAASSPDSPPMPLDASLLAFENELRLLRPLDMDFPTGQRVLQALEREIAAVQPSAPPILAAFPPLSPPHAPPNPAAFQRQRWSTAGSWTAAAALVALGWVALPYLPHAGDEIMAAAPTSGLIPFAPSGEKGTVAMVFPKEPRQEVFRPDPSRAAGGSWLIPNTREPRAFSIPEATAPLEGLLDVNSVVLPSEDCRRIGITHGVAILSVGQGGPACTHGLQKGDIILRINGAPVTTVDELSVIVRNSAPGSIAIFRIFRGHEFLELPIRLGVAPSA